MMPVVAEEQRGYYTRFVRRQIDTRVYFYYIITSCTTTRPSNTARIGVRNNCLGTTTTVAAVVVVVAAAKEKEIITDL